MTSKQALSKLKNDKKYSEEVINAIEKDLDKLEKLEKVIKILRHRIEFENLGEMQSGYVFRGYFNDCFDEDEYDLLKEVLL